MASANSPNSAAAASANRGYRGGCDRPDGRVLPGVWNNERMSGRPPRVSIAVLALVAFSSCGRLAKMAQPLRDLLVVQQALARDVGQVEAQLVYRDQNEYLVLDVVNSPWRSVAPETKRAKALEIARKAYGAFPAGRRLKAIRVVFGSHHNFGFLHYANTTDSFDFAISTLTDQLSSLKR